MELEKMDFHSNNQTDQGDERVGLEREVLEGKDWRWRLFV
jgi:hypothetical protein